MKGDALVAQSFDPESLRLEGEPVALAEPVTHSSSRGDAPFGAGGDVVIYPEATERTALIWYDRAGQRERTIAEPGSLWALHSS